MKDVYLFITSHSGLSLFKMLEGFLEKNELPLNNCREQAFDNAANMSGRYNGVQAHLKLKNKLADYIPRAAHSLNLVGLEAVKTVPQMLNFLGKVQQIYMYIFCRIYS